MKFKNKEKSYSETNKSSLTRWGFFYNNYKNQKPMGTIHLEIRDAEGGTDAKLLVKEMQDIYTKAARINNVECSLVEERNGFAHLCL